MTPTERVAAYMQERMTHAEQLEMLNIMSRAKSGYEYSVSDLMKPHVMAICQLMPRKVRLGKP